MQMKMQQSRTPNIVLMSKFEASANLSGNKELKKFIDYITRKDAIKEKNEQELSQKETAELQRIEKALEKMSHDTDQSVIEDVHTMDKYLDYMTRKKAILQTEEPALEGVFSSFKKEIRHEDVEKVKKEVASAEKTNSVMFQDVVSFKTEFLEELGYYNPKTGELNDQPLYEATKAMMEKMQEKEDLVDPFWFASIHRNTQHIHIHITCMERENTREMKMYNGQLQARGKRKQSTLDDMIFTFGSKMLNRAEEFSRISDLRNKITFELTPMVRNSFLRLFEENRRRETEEEKRIEKKMQEILDEFPYSAKGYNDRKVSDQLRSKIDDVTEYLTKDNPKRKEYDAMTKKIDLLYQKTYGKRYNPKKYYEKRRKDLNARMGNVFVKQVKVIQRQQKNGQEDVESIRQALERIDEKSNSRIGQNDFKTKHGLERYERIKQKRQEERERGEREYQEKHEQYLAKQEQISRRRNFYKIHHALREISYNLNNDLEKYRAMRDYEMAQRAVEREQHRMQMGYDF